MVLVLERLQALGADRLQAMSLQCNKGRVGRDIGAARTWQRHRYVLDDAPGGRAHDQHAVGEEDRLVHVMGDEQDRGLELSPEPQSISKTVGLLASARAMPTLCCMPPESSAG